MHLKLAAGIGTATVALTSLFVADAGASAPPKPTTVAKNVLLGRPQLLVDSKGTVSVAWEGQTSSGTEVMHYARKTKHAKHFSQVKLPKLPKTTDPFLYQAAKGVLQIIVTYNSSDIEALRSTDDGAKWKKMNTKKLDDPALKTQGIYLYSTDLATAPGGPIGYFEDDGVAGGKIYQLNENLTKITPVGSDTNGIIGLQLARSWHHTLFQLGVSNSAPSDPSKLQFQAGKHTGSIAFPKCANSSLHDNLAAGKTVAVVAETGCGHVWTRTISPAGKVGALKTIGQAAGTAASPDSFAWVGVGADSHGHFTAAFFRPGGDAGVARSTNGSTWKTSSRSVPVANSAQLNSAVPTISVGANTWYAAAGEGGTNSVGQSVNVIKAIPLTKTYAPPRTPSGKGIPHAKHARLGSLAVTVPGKLPIKHWKKTGQVTVRLSSVYAGHLSVDVYDTFTKAMTVNYICSNEASEKVAVRKVRTVTLSCNQGGYKAPISTSKHDIVTFSFTGRNGPLTVTSHVS